MMASSAVPEQQIMELTMIPAGAPKDAGSCLDGSAYGMYQLLNHSSDNWII